MQHGRQRVADGTMWEGVWVNQRPWHRKSLNHHQLILPSDPHLGDLAVLATRPLGSVAENRTLLEHRRVQPDETIICLGDVGHADAWTDEDLAAALAACEGKRLLVIGNHDVNDFEELGRAGFGPQYAAAGATRARRSCSRTCRSGGSRRRPSMSTATCTTSQGRRPATATYRSSSRGTRPCGCATWW